VLDFEVLVVGGGHAGIEAASAASRIGCSVGLVTQDLSAIGRMSCNPAIGGVAKGQLVREIDALGGLMGRAADVNGIHFRMLNSSRGAAVWGPRAQQDMDAYSVWMRAALESDSGIGLVAGEVSGIVRSAAGFRVDLSDGRRLQAARVVVTTGTFAGGRLFRGEESWEGGRTGEPPAAAISRALGDLGFRLRRLKTGTPARLRAGSIDWSLAEPQDGDAHPWPFSTLTETVQNRIRCHIVRTSAETHDRLRGGFSRSPLFTGAIEGIGPRYCPSIEDKVSRFADRDSHQLFLEPEGLGNDRIYVNGFSSSLPAEVQDAALRTIPSLAGCEVIRYGYAVEYDAVEGTALHPTLEARDVPGLFLAGQTCGTSGYEEAAAQGLVAGANAALGLRGREPFLPDRATSYMGVLVDDLTRLSHPEPYRLFTSRAEHRLHLRHDNAEERLSDRARELGLLDDSRWESHQGRNHRCERLRETLGSTRVEPAKLRVFLEQRAESVPDGPVRLLEIARRPQVVLADLLDELGMQDNLPDRLGLLRLDSALHYEGFFEKERREIERVQKQASRLIPTETDWMNMEGLSIEAREVLARERPRTVDRASRLPGVRPADLVVLLLRLRDGDHRPTRVDA
jgi:tRNA uridine 5-carboxymethylaminomethyl modification enzyme